MRPAVYQLPRAQHTDRYGRACQSATSDSSTFTRTARPISSTDSPAITATASSCVATYGVLSGWQRHPWNRRPSLPPLLQPPLLPLPTLLALRA